jgi:Transposase
VHAFFDALGARRAGQLTHVSADAAEWIGVVVADRAPQAVRCADAFHVVAWATEAPGRPRPSTRSAVAPGTVPAGWPGPPGGPAADASWPRAPRSAANSKEPGMRCGRTPRTSPSDNATSRPGSRRPTRHCTVPTCSKRACGTSSRSKVTGQGSSRPLAGLGRPQPHPGLRRPGSAPPPLPAPDRRRPGLGAVQRPHRGHQHQNPRADPGRVRLRRPLRPDRPGHAQPRRRTPHTPRPMITKSPTEASREPVFRCRRHRPLRGRLRRSLTLTALSDAAQSQPTRGGKTTKHTAPALDPAPLLQG